MKKGLILIIVFMTFMLFNSRVLAKENIEKKSINSKSIVTSVVEYKYLNLKPEKIINTYDMLAKNNANNTSESSIDWSSLIGKGINVLRKVARVLGVALIWLLKTLSGFATGLTTTSPVSTQTTISTSTSKTIWNSTTKSSKSSTTSTSTSKSSGCPTGFSEYDDGFWIFGESYCVVYNYDAPKTYNMEQQQTYGDGCCSCYASAYYRKITGQNVQDGYWNKSKGCSCTKTGLPSHTSMNSTFDAIINQNKPAIAKLNRKVDEKLVPHYVLFVGVKKSAIGNSTHDLNDFLILDTYDKSLYNAGVSKIPYYKKTYSWIWDSAQY